MSLRSSLPQFFTVAQSAAAHPDSYVAKLHDSTVMLMSRHVNYVRNTRPSPHNRCTALPAVRLGCERSLALTIRARRRLGGSADLPVSNVHTQSFLQEAPELLENTHRCVNVSRFTRIMPLTLLPSRLRVRTGVPLTLQADSVSR